MGIFDRVERGLERAVKAPFARVFKAEVQPVEIASAMRGAMDERAAILGPGRTMVPNVFTIELATSDYERLSSFVSALTDELVAAAEDHADAQRYTPAGTLEVRLVSDAELETGIFRVRPASRSSRRPTPSERRPEPVRGPAERFRPPAAAPAGPDRAQPPRPAPLPVPGHVTDRPSTRAFPVTAPQRPRPAAPGRGPRPWVDIDGTARTLSAAVTTFGRDASADVMLDDPGVSRRHAELRISNDGPHLQVVVRDLGSTNGTYLNGDQVGSEQLKDGDRLTMGRSTITFHLDGGR